MATLLEYKCPCCGGAISFDSESQKMKCPYCDTEFDVETLKGYDEDLKSEGEDSYKWDHAGGGEWTPGEEDGLRIYNCESCGGEVIGDETLAATLCPFCGNPVVMKCQFRGELKPDCVIPFKLDKKAAIEGFSAHLSGKKLLPKVFRDENKLEEIKGVYVPFWLFDTDAEASIRYKATRVDYRRDSEYDYTITSFYSVFREGKLSFDNVPVDGSEKMPDDLMESTEPYDLSEAVDFQTAYLSGFFADKYDVSAEKSEIRANERVKFSTERAFESTVNGYTSLIPESTTVRLSGGKARYALFPVWLMKTKWKDETFTFAMNGQTGKFVGNLPTDKGAALRWFFGIAGAVTAAVFALSFLF